jgi:hypothetical protein
MAVLEREAVADLVGDTLEIRFGTGLNLAYNSDHIRELTTVDPSPGWGGSPPGRSRGAVSRSGGSRWSGFPRTRGTKRPPERRPRLFVPSPFGRARRRGVRARPERLKGHSSAELAADSAVFYV